MRLKLNSESAGLWRIYAARFAHMGPSQSQLVSALVAEALDKLYGQKEGK